MAPPAKRRKRKVVEDSDGEDDDGPRPIAKNTLKNFLFSSPDAKKASPTAVPPDSGDANAVSPTPLRRKSTLSSTQSQEAPASSLKLPVKLSRENTKSPSTSPDKPRLRPQKKSKTEERGKSADIMSLFSKQAQKNLSNGSTNGKAHGKKEKTPALDDIISDPISEDDDVALNRAVVSSIVGQNAQKRFKGSSQPALSASTTVTASQKFMRPLKPTGTVAANDDQLRPWSERFAPANLDELAVHKRKVADVRRWLEEVLAGRIRQRLLVLKGAAGTGKTTTVQLLSKQLGCEILEWRNPAGSLGATQGYQSASAQFEEFLGRGGRFGQLDLDSDSDPSTAAQSVRSRGGDGSPRRQIILIEEFPNTFMRSSTALTSFRSNVLQFLAANTPALAAFGQQTTNPVTPIVMIISETLLTTMSASADSFTAHRLLGPEITRHPGTAVIEFNAVAPTLLTKALELVVQKEARKSGRRRTPGPLVLKRLGEVGDIRSAISALEFLMVKGDDDAEWGSKVAFTKPKKALKDVAMTKGEQESLELITQRESSLGIFHAVGKVVYNKRNEHPFPEGSDEALAETFPAHMAHLARPKRSEVYVDTLIDETGTDTSTFISALHENYVGSCEPPSPLGHSSSLDYVNGCIEYLSESDLLCPSWDMFFGGRGFPSNYFGKDSGSHILRQDEMAFQVAVRGLLFSLPSPVKRKQPHGGKGSDAFKMFYPASLKLWRAKEELEGLVDMWATRILKGEDAGPGPPSGNTATTTNGSAASRRGTQPNLDDWASPTKAKSLQPSQPVKSESKEPTSPAPMLSLGSSARREMLLERLPYMAQIVRGRRCSLGGMGIRDLDKMVTFQGIGAPATEDDSTDEQDDDVVAQAGGETWATDKPTEEETPRKKGLGAMIRSRTKNETSAASSLPVQSLVLSDDDIEDD